MKIKCFGSGSSGNCYRVEFIGGETVYLECGIAPAIISEPNQSIVGKTFLVTHEHGDHAKFATELSKRYSAEIISRRKTLQKIECHGTEIEKHLVRDGIDITAYDVTHNAVDPVCYKLSDGIETLLYVTDTGIEPDVDMEDVTAVILESNYTVNRLAQNAEASDQGLYVGGRSSSIAGHMSSLQAFNLIDVYINQLELIILHHVSSRNFDMCEFMSDKQISDKYKQKVVFAMKGKEYRTIEF